MVAEEIEPGHGHDMVEVWIDEDRLWRYRYRDPATGTALDSNRSYPSEKEAVDSAALAYPGVPVVERPTERTPSSPGKTLMLALTVIVGVLSIVLVVGAVVMVAVAARRLRRLLPGR